MFAHRINSKFSAAAAICLPAAFYELRVHFLYSPAYLSSSWYDHNYQNIFGVKGARPLGSHAMCGLPCPFTLPRCESRAQPLETFTPRYVHWSTIVNSSSPRFYFVLECSGSSLCSSHTIRDHALLLRAGGGGGWCLSRGVIAVWWVRFDTMSCVHVAHPRRLQRGANQGGDYRKTRNSRSSARFDASRQVCQGGSRRQRRRWCGHRVVEEAQEMCQMSNMFGFRLGKKSPPMRFEAHWLAFETRASIEGSRYTFVWSWNGFWKTSRACVTPNRRKIESFYGSPPTFLETKSPVLKPAPGRIYCNTVPLATPTSSFDRPLQTATCLRMLFSRHPFSCRAAMMMKRSLKKTAGLDGGGGAIVE